MKELKKQLEIDFLKTKTYEEINDMFNQLNDKLKLAESEVKKFRLGAVSGQSEQLACNCGNSSMSWYGNDDDKKWFCFNCKKEVNKIKMEIEEAKQVLR